MPYIQLFKTSVAPVIQRAQYQLPEWVLKVLIETSRQTVYPIEIPIPCFRTRNVVYLSNLCCDVTQCHIAPISFLGVVVIRKVSLLMLSVDVIRGRAGPQVETTEAASQY